MSILSIQLINYIPSPQQNPEKILNYILTLLISFYLDHALDSGYLENTNI